MCYFMTGLHSFLVPPLCVNLLQIDWIFFSEFCYGFELFRLLLGMLQLQLELVDLRIRILREEEPTSIWLTLMQRITLTKLV